MSSANPGDLAVSLVISSPRAGTWDASSYFLSGSVVEEIFTPGVVAELEVIDYFDFIGQMQLGGDEIVTFSMTKVANNTTASYTFLLNSVKEIDAVGALHGKVYKLMCISLETLRGQGYYVQGSYNTTIDSIVSTLFGMLGSNLGLVTEATQGPRFMNIQNQPIYQAIEMLRKDAVSAPFPASNYMFWQTWQSFHFETMEGMCSHGDVKSFVQENAVGHSIFTNIDNNILAWKVNQLMDAMSRIKAGVLSQVVSTFNVFTNEFRVKTTTDGTTQNDMGSFIITDMPTFRQLFDQAERAVIRYVNPNQNLNIGPSSMPDAIPNKMVNMAQFMEQQLHMTVIGDPVLTAGSTITCNVPQVTAAVGSTQQDIQVSGRWLISKVEHNIRRPDIKPRWIDNIEGLKGAYQT